MQRLRPLLISMSIQGLSRVSVLMVAIAALTILSGGLRAPNFAGAATTLTLDTFRSDNAPAKKFGPVLEEGQDYRVTVVGTYSKSAAGEWKDPPCGGTPEINPMFPSPGTINGQVGRDAEWKFAVLEGDLDCVSPHPELRISVDGATFQNLPADDTGTAPDPEHKYHYTVTGEGASVGFLLNDSGGTNNNYGVLQITINPIPLVEFTQAIQELQTIKELQADLEGDGKPPVPIVAGKPAVMRVYMDPSRMLQITSLLRRLLPTDNVSVLLTGDQVRREVSDFVLPVEWWRRVNQDLKSMYGINDSFNAALGFETVYYGLAHNLALTGSVHNVSARSSHAAASKPIFMNSGSDAIQGVVAQRIGHAMGLYLSPTALPARSGGRGCWIADTDFSPWPHADNMLRSGGEIQVGFDVANQTALPGDLFYDLMGFCAAPPPSTAPGVTAWISPFSTAQLLEPVGPLAIAPISPQAAPVSVALDFWLVGETLDESSADLDPLVTLELEAPADTGTGTHKIEVRDSGDGVLFTRLFTPTTIESSALPGEEAPEELSTFFEMIPVQEGAASIQIFDATDSLIGQVAVSGEAPTIEIEPPQVSTADTTLNVSWTVTDPDSTEHTYWVDYSADGGQTWQNQAMALTEPGLALDPAMLAGSDAAVVRVIASDGVNSGEAISQPFTVAGKAPHGEIIGPSRETFRLNDLVWLEAAAWDIDDGTLDDGAVTWSSSRDGNLGNGASLPVYDLSVGSHTITMTAKDSDNNTATDSISTTVFDGPIVEIGAVADVDCSGAVGVADALALLYEIAGLDAGSCKTIGEGEPIAFGDADCDGIIGPGDVVAVLAVVADVPKGCARALGFR